MKHMLFVLLGSFIILGFMSCASGTGGDVSSKMTFYTGQTVPDEFFQVASWAADHVTLEVRVDFKVIHMYHILLDEAGKPVAEGWYKTVKMGATYTVVMKPKPGLVFEAGKKYRLCIGSESPEKVFIATSSYPCMSDFEFVLK